MWKSMTNKIKKIFRLLLALSLTFLVLVFAPRVQAQDVDFDITALDIVADVEASGDVHYQEIYTYDVNYFNGMRVNKDYGGHTLTNYKVGILNPETGQVDYLKESNNQTDNTFSYVDNGREGTFTVYRRTEDQKVKLVLEYTLDGVITNYNDTAEFNQKIVGSAIDERLDVTARINLPGKVANKEDFRAWGHGPSNGQVYPKTENNQSYIEVEVPSNPSNQFVEVHAIFPTSLTPNNTNVVAENKKENIIETENAQVEADRKAHQKNQLILLSIAAVFALLGLPMTVFLYFFYFRARKKANPQPVHVPDHVYSLPDDVSPAVMAAAVLRPEPNSDDFSATILDLARKKYIHLNEIKKEKRGFLNFGTDETLEISLNPQAPSRDLLQKHEQYVLDYLTPEEGQSQTLEDISERISHHKSYRKQQNSYWTRFKNNAAVKGERLFGPKPKIINALFALCVLGIVMTVIATILSLVSFWPQMGWQVWVAIMIWNLANILALIVLMVLVWKKPPMTTQQDKMTKEWQGFANMLEDVGQMDMRQVASLPLWDEYLVYAVSLGVADKVIDAMNKTYGAEELETLSMPGTFYSNPFYINQMLRNSVSENIVSAAPKPSSYSGSNSGGFGGGFSGGSSGGFGGGSGAGGF